jgi:hypothetical protein
VLILRYLVRLIFLKSGVYFLRIRFHVSAVVEVSCDFNIFVCTYFSLSKYSKSTSECSYMGYVQVDHGRLKEDMEALLDLNSDGKIDKDDANLGYNKVMKVLAFNLPAGGGFGAGFMGGLRTG